MKHVGAGPWYISCFHISTGTFYEIKKDKCVGMWLWVFQFKWWIPFTEQTPLEKLGYWVFFCLISCFVHQNACVFLFLSSTEDTRIYYLFHNDMGDSALTEAEKRTDTESVGGQDMSWLMKRRRPVILLEGSFVTWKRKVQKVSGRRDLDKTLEQCSNLFGKLHGLKVKLQRHIGISKSSDFIKRSVYKCNVFLTAFLPSTNEKWKCLLKGHCCADKSFWACRKVQISFP